MLKILTLLSFILFLPSCTFIPKIVDDPDNSRCNLSTSKRVLDVTAEGSDEFLHECADSDSHAASGCLVFATLYSTASAIISGTIVAIGNTIHWLEKQVKCSDEPTN